MMRFRVSRIAAAIAAVALTIGVVGCSGIPRSGDVHQGQPVMQDQNNPIEFLPSSPADGATQEQILRGFLDAASSPQEDFAIARQFLATAFKTTWDASASATVDLGARSVTLGSETAATLETVTSATVDDRGQYHEVKPTAPLTLNYEFVSEGGQWRISAAPAGIVIDHFTFDQIFASHALYFFDPTFLHLVPDVRWFPTGSFTTTRVMKALLLGPADWLAQGGAVVTAFPPKTALVADTVPIDKRVAHVDLTSQALGATHEGLQLMQEQAAASLNSVDAVATVELLIEGNVQDVASSANPTIDADSRVDGRPVVMQGGLFGFLDTASIVPISGLSELIQPLNPSAVSVATSLALAAARTDAGVVLVRSTTGVTVLDARPGLISPSVDPFNYIWSVPAAVPTELLVFSTDGKATPVGVPWPNASSIVSLNISQDGTRLIALLEEDGRSRFVAASIQRGDRNVPVAVGTPIELATGSGTPLDAAWVDPSTVVSLVQGADGSSHLVSQSIGGQSADLPASVPVVSLAGANVITQLRTRGSDGSLYALRGSTYWQLIASKVSVLATMQ